MAEILNNSQSDFDEVVLVPDSSMEVAETSQSQTQSNSEGSRSSPDTGCRYTNVNIPVYKTNHTKVDNNKSNNPPPSNVINVHTTVNSKVNPSGHKAYKIRNVNNNDDMDPEFSPEIIPPNQEAYHDTSLGSTQMNSCHDYEHVHQPVNNVNTDESDEHALLLGTPLSQFIDLESSASSNMVLSSDFSVNSHPNPEQHLLLESTGNSSESTTTSMPHPINKKRKLEYNPTRIPPTENSSETSFKMSFPSPSPVIRTRKFPQYSHTSHLPSNLSPSESPQTPKPNNERKLIIEPISKLDQNSPDPPNVKKFFSNDIGLYKSIHTSLFGKYNVVNITKNLRKNLLIITLQSLNQIELDSLLAITELNNYLVKTRLPAEEQFVRGVIGPIGLDTPLNEIKESLSPTFPQLCSVERIVKGPSKIPTLSVKLTFSGIDLPSVIHIGYQRFSVSAFIGKPWQCYNCQKFGHNANVCRSRSVCATCSAHHKTAECPQVSLPLSEKSFKCTNCHENHSANYGGCPKIQVAKKVEKYRAELRLSYRDALKKAQSSSMQQIYDPIRSQSVQVSDQTVLPPSPSNRPFSSQSTHPPSSPTPAPYTKLCDASVQTEPLLPTPALPPPADCRKNEDFVTKITLFMVSLFKLQSNAQPSQIDHLVNSIMGVTLTKDHRTLLDSLSVPPGRPNVSTSLNDSAPPEPPNPSDPSQHHTSAAELVKLKNKNREPRIDKQSPSPRRSSRKYPSKFKKR